MNSPQQANAAQLAARTIKAKPRGRLAGQKSSGFPPIQNNNPNNNAAVGGGSGGGLFGGSVAAPGAFNFSAPAGTPSFSPSFGDSTPNPFAQSAASTNHDDPRADSTGEEALRKSKGFSGGFRAAGEDEVALFASHSPFHNNQQQQSNTSGSSNNTQPQNMFGAANATQSNGGGFQFGSSTPQTQASTSGFGGFNFTPTSQATDNNSNSTFAFGSSSQAPVNNSTPAFNFGATNSGSAENSLNFGANSLSKAQNPLTLENQKASNFYSDPSQILFGFNNSPTTFSNNQPDNSTFDQQFFHSNEDAGNMFGNYRVEYPPEAGQAPVQPSQVQYPTGQLGLSADTNYRGSFSARPTESIFANGPMLADYRANQNQFVQENSGTSFGQNNTNNSFGAQNNSFGGSFGGSFANQANTSFTGLNSTSAAPSNSQSLFGNTTATTSAPSSSFTSSFTATSAAPSTTNLFGSTSASFPTTSAPTTTTNLFGSVNSSFPPATASSTPLFGAAKPAEATPAASSTSIFGSVKPAEATPSTSNTSLFGSVKPAESAPTAPSNSLFGNPKPAESTPSTSSNSLFGNPKPAESTPPTSSNSLFGGFKPTDSTPTSSSTSNIFANPSATPASATPFTGFGKPVESTPNLFNPNNQINGQSNNLFGSKSAEEPKDKQTLDLFSPNRPAGQQLFESNTTNSSPEKASAQTPSALFASFGKQNSSAEHQLGGAAKEQAFAAPSTSQSESSFKIRGTAEASSLNKASSPFKSVDTPTDAAQPVTSNLFNSFSSKSQDVQPSNGSLSNGSDSYSMALTAPTDSSSQSPPSNNKALAPVKRALAPGRLSDFEFQVSEPTDMEMDSNMPLNFNAVQRREFKALWRIASVQRSMAAYFQHLPPGADPSKGLAWMEAKKKEILAEYNIDHISNKRGRAEADLENDENQENMSPQKRVRQDRERSHRIASPEKRSRSTRSPERQRSRATNDSESEINSNSVLKAPKLQPGRSSSPSKSPSRSAAPEPTPSKKRRSDTQSEIGGGENGGHKKRRPEQSSHNEGVDSGNSKKIEEVDTGSSKKRRAEVYLTQNDPEGIEDGKNSNKKTLNGSSSSTSNMFKNILDSPDNSTRSVSPERKTRALPGATKEAASVPAVAPVANPFGNLAGASPIKPNTAATSTTPSKPPVFAFAPTSTTPTTSPTKPPTFTGTSGIKPPIFAGAPTGGIKPPTFGSAPVNFMAQFGKKAVAYAEDNEKILMQKAKDEEFDSDDDDEAEWEAKYKEKRAAELKELEELAQVKAPSFLVKSTDTPKATEPKETAKPAATNIFSPVATTTSTPLFGQAKPATGAAESIFNSANTSRASTPNLFSSNGSVLDGAASASGKTPSFSGNPFAHLSDVESKNQDDEDDESSDGGSNSDGEGEKKDPSYQQNPSKGTTSTPSTPADENGSSNISKKALTEPPKFNLFGSAAKTDAATPTPGTGGSLSSRMSFGAAPEEKVDSAPKPATNIFGSSFGATSSTPEDKTWKPNTPIKFGSDAPSAPVFNFTSATPSSSTPTKPTTNPLGGLFGSSGTSASTLFGGSTATTGFQFGAPPSAPASSFPSADASRANSPGATTDGADDNDPEKVHAQVNLLESSPGEENEDAIYSVRTRALKFNSEKVGDAKSSPWDTKGVGPLKVLSHKETKATRIVLRSDPSGSIIINRSLFSKFKYEASGKTVKLNTVGDDGKLETWVLQLKNVELAEELAKSLEENKINN